MCSKMWTEKYTENSFNNKDILNNLINEADSIVIGAGAGLSTSAGLLYSGSRFEKYFSDFKQKYGITDMYSGGFYPFETQEELWAWWSRHIFYNRYDFHPNQIYSHLLNLVSNKDYFVITTNVDHLFQKSGFDKSRLFYTQGDYGLFQCSKPCHSRTYNNESIIRQMVSEEKNMKIPTELIPRCPICNQPMTTNLRKDSKFVEDEGWHKACESYTAFLEKRKNAKVLYLEIGVGYNTPGIIKYPFWKMTFENKNARYLCVNNTMIYKQKKIENQAFYIEADANDVIA